MPRNLTDLPLNDEPQDTDWLLGASGISPAVFQKIPVGLVKAPSSSGGGSIFVPINEPTALTEGGLFFTDTLASNLLVTFDSPPVGTYIRWLNYSSKSVVLGGFTTADGVAIPTDKGLLIVSTGFLEGFVNSAGNFKQLSGNYTINWFPGIAPPFLTFTYASPGDTNGIIYYLGATKHSSAFINPHTRGEIVATADSFVDVRSPQKAFDRGNDGNNSVWVGDTRNTGWLQIEFKNGQSAIITSFELWASSAHALSTFMGSGSKLQGSTNAIDWNDIFTFFPNVGGGARWYSGSFANTNNYNFYRFWSPVNNYHIIGDIELYGQLLS